MPGLLKVRSAGLQDLYHLGPCQKCRISDPILNLLNQNLHVSKITREFLNILSSCNVLPREFAAKKFHTLHFSDPLFCTFNLHYGWSSNLFEGRNESYVIWLFLLLSIWKEHGGPNKEQHYVRSCVKKREVGIAFTLIQAIKEKAARQKVDCTAYWETKVLDVSPTVYSHVTLKNILPSATVSYLYIEKLGLVHHL